jgi:transposase
LGTPIPNCKRGIKKLLALARDPSVDLWALDEVHFQQHGSRCRMWVPAELKDPILLHAPTRKSVSYFGAVRLRDGKLLTRKEGEVFDAQSFWQFLKELRQVSARSRRRVVVISDNAKYHHALLHKSWRQQAEPQFALHFLPPYSPQLNPIERVWKLTRRLRLHNVYFANLQQVADCADEQFQSWKTPNDALRKLCAFT